MGTKQTISTNPQTGTDALFRAWGLAHSTALAAAGMVQTADTGQINWVTVLKPAAGVTAGYEVWRFADAMQATAPIFVKISYGIGAAAAANTASITAVVVGTGSNGSGTITGAAQIAPSATNPSMVSTVNATNANSASYICHPAGSLVLVTNQAGNAGIVGTLLVIDRTRDTFGAATGVGACIWWTRYVAAGAGVFVSCYGLNFSAGSATGPLPPVAVVPDAASTSPAGSVLMSRHYAQLPALGAVVACLTYLNGEVVALSEFDVVPMGLTSRHYLALGSASAQNAAANQGNTTANGAATNEALATLAVVWES